MATPLIAYRNRADGATLSHKTSAFDSSYPATNLADGDVDLVARTADDAVANTRLLVDLGAAYSLRVLALAKHNISSAGQWRVRVGTAPLDVDLNAPAVDHRLSASGAGWLVTGADFTAQHSASAGTIYAEFDTPASGTRPIVSLDDNTGNEQILLYSDGTDLKFKVIDGGVTQCDITIGTIAAATTYKAAVAWGANDFAACLAGGTVGTDVAGSLPTVDRMRLKLDQAGNTMGGDLERVARWPTRLPNATLQAITFYGPDHETVEAHNTGWVDALSFNFHGDEPARWGAEYDALVVFDEVQARYATIEINDTANPDGYIQAGRLFIGGGLQPAKGRSFGRTTDGRTELSGVSRTPGGKKWGTERRRARRADFALGWLTQAEADEVHELQAAAGVLGEVLYVPDPDDMARSQRYGGLGLLAELGPIEYPYPLTRAIPFRWEEKL